MATGSPAIKSHLLSRPFVPEMNNRPASGSSNPVLNGRLWVRLPPVQQAASPHVKACAATLSVVAPLAYGQHVLQLAQRVRHIKVLRAQVQPRA